MKNLKNKFDFLEKKVGKEPPFGVLPVFCPERIKGKKLVIPHEYVEANVGNVTVGVEGEPLILNVVMEIEKRSIGVLNFIVFAGSSVTFKKGFSLYAPETMIYVRANNVTLEEEAHFFVSELMFTGNVEKFPDNFTIGELVLPTGLKELPKNLNVVECLTVPSDFWRHVEGMSQDRWNRLTQDRRKELIRLELEDKRNGAIGLIHIK